MNILHILIRLLCILELAKLVMDRCISYVPGNVHIKGEDVRDGKMSEDDALDDDDELDIQKYEDREEKIKGGDNEGKEAQKCLEFYYELLEDSFSHWEDSSGKCKMTKLKILFAWHHCR